MKNLQIQKKKPHLLNHTCFYHIWCILGILYHYLKCWYYHALPENDFLKCYLYTTLNCRFLLQLVELKLSLSFIIVLSEDLLGAPIACHIFLSLSFCVKEAWWSPATGTSVDLEGSTWGFWEALDPKHYLPFPGWPAGLCRAIMHLGYCAPPQQKEPHHSGTGKSILMIRMFSRLAHNNVHYTYLHLSLHY